MYVEKKSHTGSDGLNNMLYNVTTFKQECQGVYKVFSVLNSFTRNGLIIL